MVETLRILTWNIRQGGKKAAQQIVDSLVGQHADVMVLTEYKNNPSGEFILGELQYAGWQHIQTSDPPHNENGVAIISSIPLMKQDLPFDQEHGAHRWNEVYISDLQLYLLGVHVPNVNETYDKLFHWERVLDYARRRSSDKCVIIGDFNTAIRNEKPTAPLKYSSFITALLDSGWVDAWKHCNREITDYTWFSHRKNGFRLDYIFLSQKLSKNLITSEISHDERIKNYSDHSLVTAELLKI